METFETNNKNSPINIRVSKITSKAELIGSRAFFTLYTEDLSDSIFIDNIEPLYTRISKRDIINYPILEIRTNFLTNSQGSEQIIRETELEYKLFDILTNKEYVSNFPDDYNPTTGSTFAVYKRIKIILI